MKTITVILLNLSIAISGCEKCETCTTTTVTTVSVSTPGYPQTITTSFDACGDDLEKWDGDVTTSNASSGGITATSTARTVCN